MLCCLSHCTFFLKYTATTEIYTDCNSLSLHDALPISFFKDLVDFMSSGPVFVQVLEGENAIQTNRDLMGATDPKKAEAGTIRADFADSIDANAVHGSEDRKSTRLNSSH